MVFKLADIKSLFQEQDAFAPHHFPFSLLPPPDERKKENFSCTVHLPQSFSAYRHEFPKGYDKPGDGSRDLKKSNSIVKHFISNNIWEQFKRKSQKPNGEE